MLPTNIGSIDLDAVIMRDEPKWNEEMKTYDFAYMTTPKFTNYYSDMRTSGYNDHYVFVPLDRTYHVDEIFTSLRQQYYVGESVTRKLAYGLVYNEILHMWWHGDSVLVPKIKSFENDDAKKNSIDFINDYIPVDIAMNMNADQEYIVFEKSYIPIVQSMAEEYVNLMNYLIDGSTNSATRILHENDKHDFKVVLNVTD